MSKERNGANKKLKLTVSQNTKHPSLKLERDNIRAKQNYLFHMTVHKFTDKEFKEAIKGRFTYQ